MILSKSDLTLKGKIQKMKFSSEAEFGQAIDQILLKSGFETWKEVGDIDLVAMKDNQYYIIELKLTMNDKLLEQSYINYCNFKNVFCISIIPSHKNYKLSHVKEYFMQKNNIGLWIFDVDLKDYIKECDIKFEIGEYSSKFILGQYDYIIYEKVHPKLSENGWDISKYLFDDQKNCIAGSVSGNSITPFKRSCALIKEHISKNGKMTYRQIWDDLHEDLHWMSVNSFRSAMANPYNLEIVTEIKNLL